VAAVVFSEQTMIGGRSGVRNAAFPQVGLY
jgi:hypothetical protein